MLQEYNEVFNPGLSSDWISIGSRFRRNYITRAAVAVATAYFLHKQYYLSAELLMRARTNALWGMTYIPISSGVVTRTALFKDIGANEEWDNETSAQFKGGTLAEDDAHYAINWFNFTTERTLGGTLIHITDVYDFDFDFGDAYTGVVGFGANVMAIAQRVGVLTPYNVKIDQWYYGDMYI